MQVIQNRRTLHQPFFPLSSPPPTSQPTPSPPFPKYPFSTNPQQPFFPDYPSPPSSGSASVPTFPANISSLIYPTSSHPAPHPSPHSRLLPAILFSLIALSLLALSAAFLFHRRRRRLLDPIPESNNKLPSPHPPPATSPGPPSSEFLYLGTLVNSTTTTENQAAAPAPAPAPTIANNSSVPAAKLGSPELTPLPPLSRSVRTNYGNATAAAATDSDDEFYSPKGSESRSRAEAAEEEKCGSRSSDSSTPSYPDSNSDGSASPIGSSPGKSEDSRSGTPPPPPPPPSMRPLTPSPPKRKPPSPSPLSSPIEKSSRVSVRSAAKFKESDGNLRKHEFSGQNSRNQASAPAPAAPPPPPPPPPPPAGYWESQVRKPPVVATPKSAASKRPVVVEFAENSDSVERSEETTPRPKLKPLHWDKVRASSDRVMVWDQLKSSSFQ